MRRYADKALGIVASECEEISARVEVNRVDLDFMLGEVELLRNVEPHFGI